MGIELENLLLLLRQHAMQQALFECAEEGCRRWFLNELDEMPYPLAAIRFERASQALSFYNAALPYPYITTTLRLFVDEREVGDYRLITLLDGTVDDDYLVFDGPAAQQWQRR